MTDSSETNDSDTDKDTDGTASSKEEAGEDGTVTDNDGEEDNGRGKVSCPIDTWEALAQMNKAMGVNLKRGHKILTDSFVKLRIKYTRSKSRSRRSTFFYRTQFFGGNRLEMSFNAQT